MAEQEIVEFDEVYDTDIENANQATSRETRDFTIFLREKRTSPSYLSEFLQRFDSLTTHAPSLELVKSCSAGLIETSVIRLEPEWVALEHHYKTDFGGNLSHPILEKPLAYCFVDKDLLFVCGFMQKGSLDNHLFRKYPAIQPESCRKWVKTATQAARGLPFHRNSEKQVTYRDLKSVNLLLDDNYRDLKASNMFLDGNVKSTSKFKNHAIDAGDFTALNIPPASPRCRKTDMKIEKTLQWTGAPTAKNINEKASRQSRSYLHKTCPMKVRNESQCNIYHVLLLISTLLATITFHTALKFYLPGCRFQEGYESSSSVNSVCQIENQSSSSNRILIMFNSVVFFLSAALMMILFNELPFRPWLLVLVLSMVGSYICTFMDPINPSSFSS
ncbi:hypothetical protein EZV62_005491 [Acer yangbiense]|uniref:Serine-threonine/tyrosine-protein kinase catalytic domain-containing protein n=1 Tax=Acer yangbiense TaxID=1000413 RepID=A0A5C7IPY1_9ROSI|nr:hypothetical protein EZV62_005491 [Acer yangbiense]